MSYEGSHSKFADVWKQKLWVCVWKTLCLENWAKNVEVEEKKVSGVPTPALPPLISFLRTCATWGWRRTEKKNSVSPLWSTSDLRHCINVTYISLIVISLIIYRCLVEWALICLPVIFHVIDFVNAWECTCQYQAQTVHSCWFLILTNFIKCWRCCLWVG